MRRLLPAFTLVELLVVIAVIAVLVAMTLPTIGQARLRARQIVCMSQVRQQSIAMFGYVADQRDSAFPFTKRHSSRWMIRLAPYMGWSGESRVDEVTGDNLDGTLVGASNSTKRVDMHVKGFICPEANFRRDLSTIYNSGYYGINLELTSSRDVNDAGYWSQRRTLTQIKMSPARLLLAGDNRSYAEIEWVKTLNNSVNLNDQRPRGHLRGNTLALNLMFADGHIESLIRGQRNDLWVLDDTTDSANKAWE